MITEPEGNAFDSLAVIAAETDEVHVGPVQERPTPRDLFFDLGPAVSDVHSVTAVITGIGGAARVIDWVLTKLRERRGETILLKAGTTTVTVKTGDDPERARKLLKEALKIV
jgi:hypothetical protein